MDSDFYKKINVPPPKLSPEERLRSRLVFRNEVNFYKRKSDFSGKEIISVYSQDKPFKVYSYEEWWLDTWDGRSWGADFDFNKPFFEQFYKLQVAVPRLALYLQARNQNCFYINYGTGNKSCYLIMAANDDEDCYYSVFINSCKDSADCLFLRNSELCYECIDCEGCFRTIFSRTCEQCSDSAFLYDCQGCMDCVGCVGLRHKRYFWLNEELAAEEFKRKRDMMFKGGRPAFESVSKVFEALVLKHHHLFIHGRQNENVTGDYIYRSKNSENCFDVTNVEDCKWCTWLHDAKDCYDHYAWGRTAEKCYENTLVGNNAYEVKFCNNCWNDVSNLEYCELCVNCQDCFGCVGLKNSKFCVLNKQYSENDYKELVGRIKAHMLKTGEYGEFFPAALAPFAYNESCAQDHLPLQKEEALKMGYKWLEDENKIVQPQKYRLQDTIGGVADNVTDEFLICSACYKNYKIIPQELELYRQINVPLPNKCFKCRYKARLSLRNPRKLWGRACAKCGVKIQTTYAPEKSEIVYCEECYLKEVY